RDDRALGPAEEHLVERTVDEATEPISPRKGHATANHDAEVIEGDARNRKQSRRAARPRLAVANEDVGLKVPKLANAGPRGFADARQMGYERGILDCRQPRRPSRAAVGEAKRGDRVHREIAAKRLERVAAGENLHLVAFEKLRQHGP